ncbi:MAG TPA: hypothetical protein VGP93_13765, partial [Polyangiaceae bacterium]|nr:hypothetical protein [Polyangiaceae bacterium]
MAEALLTLRRLFEHEKLSADPALRPVRATVDGVERRLARKELHVVVVGESRSGKSTLLDAILGDRLLGQARGKIAVVTFIRRQEVPSFRARFASGSVDDFSKRAPDRSAQFAQAIESLTQDLAAAQASCASLRARLRAAMEVRDRVEFDSEVADDGLKALRERQASTTSELAKVEVATAEVDSAFIELERSVPELVRTPPPRWAVWLWFFHALFTLFRRSVWSRYQTQRRERDDAQTRLLTSRREATESAEECERAESKAATLKVRAEQTRAEASRAEQQLLAAEKERDRLSAELAAQRSEQEHHESERRRAFFSDLEALSGERGRARGLVELSIDYPARFLPDDVTIIDMPGMVSESGPEWQIIREQADGCILVSELDRAVSESAKLFLRQLREIVPHLLLVLTKMDKAFTDASERGGDDPWQQVEHARRIGTRRFARELGRAPETVLSISVAAEAALSSRESDLAERFETEIAKLFQLLRHERAMILGANAGSAIRRCIAGIAEAEQRAEREYREKIAELERQRTPEPDAFLQKELAAAEPAIGVAAHDAVVAAISVAQAGFVLLNRLTAHKVDACENKAGLVELATRLAQELPPDAAIIRHNAFLELEAGVERGVSAIEMQLFEALRQSYQLLHQVRRASTSAPRLGAPSDDLPSFPTLASDVEAAARSFRKARYKLGFGGMVTGAASGALVHPWIGSAAGAALGALLALA